MYVRMHKGDARRRRRRRRRRRLRERVRPIVSEESVAREKREAPKEVASSPSVSPSSALGCICRGLSRAYLGAPETLSGGFRRKELGLSAAEEQDDVRRRGHRPGRTGGGARHGAGGAGRGGQRSTVNSVIGDRRPPTWISNGDATAVAAACCIARGTCR